MEKVALFSLGFEPDENFKNFLLTKYKEEQINFWVITELNFDEDVIDYIYKNGEKVFSTSKSIPNDSWHMSIKGRPSWKRKVGFCGRAIVTEYNPNKKWLVRYTHCDMPYIVYYSLNFLNGYICLKEIDSNTER